VTPDRRAALSLAATALAAAIAACGGSAPPPVIQIQRQLVTVDNRTDHDWLGVELWINRQYRVRVPRIAAHSRFSTTLDVFVAGFGQRFDVRRQRVDDLRLTARTPDGQPVEHTLAHGAGGLAGALSGFAPKDKDGRAP
jgi:hypothetical protein